jgi:hypothetical protein
VIVADYVRGGPSSSGLVEHVILEVAKEFFDNSDSCDKTSDNMRLAVEW